MSEVGTSTRRRSAVAWTLRLVVVAGLLVEAVIHLRLAEEYEFAFPGGIGGGALFRLEAASAVAAAIAVLVWNRRSTYWVAILVASSALLAVLTARYVELPAIGPVPSMYEPVWYLEKVISAVAETVAALAGLVLLRVTPAPTRKTGNVGLRTTRSNP